MTSEKTDFFYKEIAAGAISNVLDQITYTWFDIRKYKHCLITGDDKRLIELFKFFSPEHLLKKRFQNDSNSLNTKFYGELLYIIGLEEIEDKDSHKRIITRRMSAAVLSLSSSSSQLAKISLRFAEEIMKASLYPVRIPL